MSDFWHWFVITGVFLSIAFFLWLLIANRQSDGGTTGHEWDGIEELDNPLPAWWVWMFVLSIVFALVYLVVFPGLGHFQGVLNWSSSSEHDAKTVAHKTRFDGLYDHLASLTSEELSSNAAGMQVGRRLFINNCATCHGVNAQGAPGFPNLTDDHWIWGGEYDAISMSIATGRQAAMPAWGPALGDDGVTNVANYVMALASQPHDAARASEGAAQFQTFCVSCHGPEGAGNTLLGAPSIVDADKWIYGSSLTDVAKTIRSGRQGNMPAFEDFLDERQRKILATYILSLSRDGE